MKNQTANPHDASRGTDLSSAYAYGLRGLPCPPRLREKTSAAYKAWLRGHEEWFRTYLHLENAKFFAKPTETD